MTQSPSTKLTLAVLFGGRSGEHEVSLMSARSVLSVLDRMRYNVIDTHEGAWLTGPNGLAAFEQGKTEALLPASLNPDPSRPGLCVLRGDKQEKLADVDVYFPVMHGALQGLFEMTGVACAGMSVISAAECDRSARQYRRDA